VLKKINWKLPSPFSWNILIPCYEKEFRNIILEENLIIKLKNSHDNFSGVWDFLLRYAKTMEFRDFSLEILRGRNFL
jgi:hypothetical protein